METQRVALRVENITKRFPGVLALDRASFSLRAGEVHVLFGENGAGKSTLNKIIAGSYFPDEGDIYLGEEKVVLRNPQDARMKGISAVYQEFSLVPQLTVAENLFLGRELAKGGFLDKAGMMSRARDSLSRLDFHLDPLARVASLGRAEAQMVEIAKAMQQEMSVLILDEPTASLSSREVSRLFQVIRKLKSEGVGIIYISHRIDELKQIGDRITVLRDGMVVQTMDMAEATEERLISLMTGRAYKDVFPKIVNMPGREVLSVKNLSSASGLHNVSFDVREGEIFGVAGLVGSGKSRIGRALFGLEDITGGEIRLKGETLKKITPASSLKRGILYSPQDRHREGLVLCRSVKENQTICSVPLFEKKGFIQLKREERVVRDVMEKTKVRPAQPSQTIGQLSGGNQQKVMIGRGLTRDTSIFIFDEATCGIDVGAKAEVYQFLKELSEKGATVIFSSSEVPELVHLCHRVMVMHENTVGRIIPRSEVTEENILSACFGYSEVLCSAARASSGGVGMYAAM